ncbi:hypothetical protein [Limosilactobacillus caecicola]|uniref:hypothetical protein n=1 Tax=Limosilactobacillus caecicola TaxID=2941332 RepID=UPI002041898C|nr:hypothetical protein [Limosilactobacillus caecicola]
MKTRWFEAYSKDDIQQDIDDFCEDYEVVSISITETEGPQHYLAVVVYKDWLQKALDEQ